MPEILDCVTYTYFPELASDDGGATGRYHLYRLTPIPTSAGRSARYDPVFITTYTSIDEADQAYRKFKREARQVMAEKERDA